MNYLLALCALLALATPAEARRHHHRHQCGPGEVWRVSRHRCQERPPRKSETPPPSVARHAKADRCVIVQAAPESGVVFSALPWWSRPSIMTARPSSFEWLR